MSTQRLGGRADPGMGHEKMQSVFKRIANLSIVCLIVPLISCELIDQEYREALVDKMKDTDVSNTLERWARDNVFQKQLKRSDVKFGGRMVPGLYRYETEFDWQLLGFDEKYAQVRLVGPHVRHVSDDEVTNIRSVFFAERSRLGVLVKAPDSDDYGVGSDEQFLTPISENVAVICIPPD
jgi:hypothetical protein